jgi:hypothetical protein
MGGAPGKKRICDDFVLGPIRGKKTTMIFQDFFELKKIASQAFLMILS